MLQIFPTLFERMKAAKGKPATIDCGRLQNEPATDRKHVKSASRNRPCTSRNDKFGEQGSRHVKRSHAIAGLLLVLVFAMLIVMIHLGLLRLR